MRELQVLINRRNDSDSNYKYRQNQHRSIANRQNQHRSIANRQNHHTSNAINVLVDKILKASVVLFGRQAGDVRREDVHEVVLEHLLRRILAQHIDDPEEEQLLPILTPECSCVWLRVNTIRVIDASRVNTNQQTVLDDVVVTQEIGIRHNLFVNPK